MRRIKYLDVANALIADIRSGRFKHGDRMYSRSELMNLYKIGSVTAVAVQNELAGRGYISKMQGSGSYVIYDGEHFASRLDAGVIPTPERIIELRSVASGTKRSRYSARLYEEIDRQVADRGLANYEISRYSWQNISDDVIEPVRRDPKAAYFVASGGTFSTWHNISVLINPLVHNVTIDNVYPASNAVVADMYYTMETLIDFMRAHGCKRFIHAKYFMEGGLFYENEGAFASTHYCEKLGLECVMVDSGKCADIVAALRAGRGKKTGLLFTKDIAAVIFHKATSDENLPEYMLGAMGEEEAEKDHSIRLATVLQDFPAIVSTALDLLVSPPSIHKKLIRVKGIFKTIHL